MPAKLDLAGKRFGRLVAIEPVPREEGQRYVRWRCRCDCGNEHVGRSAHINSGNIQSCGCLVSDDNKREAVRRRFTKHGASRTPEYQALMSAIARCHNPRSPAFYNYGARGVQVCAEWRADPEAFIRHVGQRPSGKHSLDRIDNNRGYEPGNVRWAVKTEQQQNRRGSIFVEFRGQIVGLAEAIRQSGLNVSTVRNRLSRGWPMERALR